MNKESNWLENNGQLQADICSACSANGSDDSMCGISQQTRHILNRKQCSCNTGNT